METIAEALRRLAASGYVDDFRAEPGGLRATSSGRLHAPDALRVDEIVRFEGESDPGDEAVVFALTAEADGTKGTYTTAYGPEMDALDAEIVQRLKPPTGSTQASCIARFRELHASGCFVLPNPWDAGSAVYLRHLGFKALATTSAGFAFTRGLPDDVRAIDRDVMLAHIRDIVEATSLPVNADFQSGYADEPPAVAANVALCIATGVAGLSIEDATGQSTAPLYERSVAVERIAAARDAIAASGIPVVLTARCEAWLVGEPDPLRIALDRLVDYAEAGADCLFAPGVEKPEEIAAIVAAVAPRPVNVLMSKPSPNLSVSRLGELGVRRVSVGSALARAAWGGFIRAARALATSGSSDVFAEAATFAELDALFRDRR
jgi:2-methylisocitrate lyase-like PEP mutase family enzyme